VAAEWSQLDALGGGRRDRDEKRCPRGQTEGECPAPHDERPVIEVTVGGPRAAVNCRALTQYALDGVPLSMQSRTAASRPKQLFHEEAPVACGGFHRLAVR
jgi:hypothetical protein